jgi:hypothetical protein
MNSYIITNESSRKKLLKKTLWKNMKNKITFEHTDTHNVPLSN